MIEEMERAVLDADGLEGLVLRYGWFYGPGTYYAEDGASAADVRKRRFPVVGNGSGLFSFIHVDDAADATVAAVERGAPGVYNMVDDEPAAMRDWLPAYAEAIGRQAAAPGAGLAGAAGGRQDGGLDERAPRRLQRQGEAGARLEAALAELAQGFRESLRASVRARRPSGGSTRGREDQRHPDRHHACGTSIR